MADATASPAPAASIDATGDNAATSTRRRRVRELVLAAAKARAQQALTLSTNNEDGDATTATPLFAPYSPSPVSMINAVWEYLDVRTPSVPIATEDLLVDLGCGDARWLISGVQRYRCQALGIEIDGALVEKAQHAVESLELTDRIRIVKDDIMRVDISQARIVIVYAFAESLHGIRAHLESQLGERASVLSIGVRLCVCFANWAGSWMTDVPTVYYAIVWL